MKLSKNTKVLHVSYADLFPYYNRIIISRTELPANYTAYQFLKKISREEISKTELSRDVNQKFIHFINHQRWSI